MLDGPLGDMFKKAQELSQNMQEKQAQLAKKTVKVSVGGEMVKMVFNGKQEALSIEIDPEIIDKEDAATLQDLVLSAVNEGIRQSHQMIQNEMGKELGGLDLGGLNLNDLK